jgi:hypothetical protein
MQTSFTIGYPRLIHPKLIAVLADLQSTVIFSIDGTILGWIHESKKHINFAYGQEAKLDFLVGESSLSDQIQGFSVSYFDNTGIYTYRQWNMKTTFLYPPMPPKPITIDTEDQY